MTYRSLKSLTLAALFGATSSLWAQDRPALTLEVKDAEPIVAQKAGDKGSADKSKGKAESVGAPKLAEAAVGPATVIAEPVHHCNHCGHGSIFGEYEQLWLKYRRDAGTRVGTTIDRPTEATPAERELAPRITLGYVSQSGLGYRARYFEFNHLIGISSDGPDEKLHLDTAVFDAEVFKAIPVGRCWSVEGALGVRYNYFNEEMLDGGDQRRHIFHGFGTVASLEARRNIGNCLAVYARVRGSWLVGDQRITNVNVNDNDDPEAPQEIDDNNRSLGILELNVGAEYRHTLRNGWQIFARASGEWQQWINYSSDFAGRGANSSERFGRRSDVGFSGVGVAFGISR